MLVQDLLFKAGGLWDSEYKKNVYLKRADLIRKLEDGINDTTITFNLQKAIQGQGWGQKILQPFDKIIIYPREINKIKNKYIHVKGFVKSPGQYNYTNNMTLADALVLANGFQEGAFLETVDIYRPIKYRGKNEKPLHYDKITIELIDGVTDKAYSLADTMEILRKAKNQVLKHRDIIRVYKDPDFQSAKSVEITGRVYFPGEYVLLEEDETLYSLVERAGGLRHNAYLGGAQFIRDTNRVLIDFAEMLEDENDKDEIALFPGDSINIPQNPNTVNITGNIGVGGLVKYKKNKRLFYYINQTGGLKDSTQYIFLTYPSGRTKKVDKFLGMYLKNPIVKDGSEILITKEPPARKKEPLDVNKVVTRTMALVTNALTILVLANRL